MQLSFYFDIQKTSIKTKQKTTKQHTGTQKHIMCDMLLAVLCKVKCFFFSQTNFPCEHKKNDRTHVALSSLFNHMNEITGHLSLPWGVLLEVSKYIVLAFSKK